MAPMERTESRVRQAGMVRTEKMERRDSPVETVRTAQMGHKVCPEEMVLMVVTAWMQTCSTG